MKVLYLDCGMGAAGDMLAAALLELLPDQDAFIGELNALGLPGVSFQKEKSVKCGITGTHMTVRVGQEEEESLDVGEGHHHHGSAAEDHHHDHTHTHHHSSMHDIEHIVKDHLPVSPKVKEDILEVYRLIAEAESHVHGVPVTQIHFHEVGTLDAVADIAAVCMLMEKLAPEKVVVSPVHVGSGQVRCAHGILPVPAPATACILKDVPIYGGAIKGELCTPTGAALLKHFADAFGEMPVMRTEAVGYGMGKKDFEAANCVRAIWGTAAGAGSGRAAVEEIADSLQDTVAELCCNIDDMTAEALGFAQEVLLEAGALDVYTIPIGMKKSRPGTLLCVLCRESDKEAMVRLIFRHTTTIGIREQLDRRYTLSRSTQIQETSFGPVRKKISEGYGVQRVKYEYEDLAGIARKEGKSLSQVLSLLKDMEES